MRPDNLSTKIFLDGGDPEETKRIKNLLGFVDGQTTNPTLVAHNPKATARVAAGEKFSQDEIFDFYKTLVSAISPLVSDSVSIEVYADGNTTTEQMVQQAQHMNTWIPNAHIKLPITHAGLGAAHTLVAQGIRVNMTLCFTQQQAAAVYAATRGAKRGQVYVSPFIGRLDDGGQDGVSLITNILQMFCAGDSHVMVLSASVRTLDHLLGVLACKSDIVTCPVKIYDQWSAASLPVPDAQYQYPAGDLRPILYEEVDLELSWEQYDIAHPLTDAGLQRFSDDWNNLITT